MTAMQELRSWLVPGTVVPKPVPSIGSEAPSTSDLEFPRPQSKSTVIAFLRHCGCPFAEQIFLRLRELSSNHGDLEFIAVSHSDRASTQKWVEAVGGAGRVNVIVDDERHIYGAFGLGIASFWHVLNPWSLAAVFHLGRSQSIWNRPTESGTRWQTAGLFAVNAQGIVQYAHVAGGADDIGDMELALKAVSVR